MKNFKKLAVGFSLSVCVLLGATSHVIAQNKPDEKRTVKTPPKLLVLDENQSYSLQNSSKLIQDVYNPSSQTTFRPVQQEIDQLGFTHQKINNTSRT